MFFLATLFMVFSKLANGNENIANFSAYYLDNSFTVKQRIFIKEYLKVDDGSEAARRAGYSIKCAYQQAYENLRKPKIKKIIDRGLEIQRRERLKNLR